MNREEALRGLNSDSSHIRLKSARYLVRNSDPVDLPSLHKALATESVSYVKSSLELAIKRSSNTASLVTSDNVEEYEIPTQVRDQIRTEALEEISGQILHEISSPLGLVASAAAREVPNYEQSKTKRHIESLKRIFNAIEQLKSATAVPKPEEFDLAELLHELAVGESDGRKVEISLQGAKPMLVTSDPALLRLAASNGIRNAIEAVLQLHDLGPHSIVITWGETDIDYWVAIIDQGAGITGPTESAFEIGKSTKKGHSGFGLTIARQAIETLGGNCTLQAAGDHGARFEIRWEK